MKIQGIYKIVNRINNKIYIGQSINIQRRFKRHKSNINTILIYPLYNAFRKYGIDNFEFIILEIVNDSFLLDQREQYWLDHYKSYDRNFGYNLIRLAHGIIHSEETRLKIGLAHKGKSKSEEHKRKIGLGNKGKIRSKKTRSKMSLVSKGKPKSEEHRKNISSALKDKPSSLKGYKHSAKTKSNMSKSHLGQIPWNKGLKTVKKYNV